MIFNSCLFSISIDVRLADNHKTEGQINLRYCFFPLPIRWYLKRLFQYARMERYWCTLCQPYWTGSKMCTRNAPSYLFNYLVIFFIEVLRKVIPSCDRLFKTFTQRVIGESLRCGAINESGLARAVAPACDVTRVQMSHAKPRNHYHIPLKSKLCCINRVQTAWST